MSKINKPGRGMDFKNGGWQTQQFASAADLAQIISISAGRAKILAVLVRRATDRGLCDFRFVSVLQRMPRRYLQPSAKHFKTGTTRRQACRRPQKTRH